METPAEDPAERARDAEQLRRFCTGFYRCLTGWADTAFELCDAALRAPSPIGSVPVLSLEPIFRRSHGSLYKALARGDVDADAMRDLLVEHRPASWPLVFAVDASAWARCDAETSPERGYSYSASKHSAGKPIVAGWSYQGVTALDWANDSWTAPMDARRIPPRADHHELPIVTGTVIRVDVEHLPKPTSRTKKTLWLWAAGPGFDLDICWRAYLRRFDIEHAFRFVKNTLGWTTPALRTPEQADRWTWLVVAAYTQLRLAHGLVDDLRLPWERQRKPGRLTPARVRRGFRRLQPTLGTQPVHQNRRHPVPDAPKAPAPNDELATQPSKRPPNPGPTV
jgi:hypothetical protein